MENSKIKIQNVKFKSELDRKVKELAQLSAKHETLKGEVINTPSDSKVKELEQFNETLQQELDDKKQELELALKEVETSVSLDELNSVK